MTQRGRPTVWTFETVLAAIDRWERQYGAVPTSYDLSPTWARRRRAQELDRLTTGAYPSPTSINRVFGSYGNMELAFRRIRSMWNALHRDEFDEAMPLFWRDDADPRFDLATETALWNEWLSVASRPPPNDPREEFYTWLLTGSSDPPDDDPRKGLRTSLRTMARARTPYAWCTPIGQHARDARWIARNVLRNPLATARSAGGQSQTTWLFDPKPRDAVAVEEDWLSSLLEDPRDKDFALRPIDRGAGVPFDRFRTHQRLSDNELKLASRRLEDLGINASDLGSSVQDCYDTYKTWGYDSDRDGWPELHAPLYSIFYEIEEARSTARAARASAQKVREAAEEAGTPVDDWDFLTDQVRAALRLDDEARTVFTDGRTVTVALVIDSDSDRPTLRLRTRSAAPADEVFEADQAIRRAAYAAFAVLAAVPGLARIDVLLLYADRERCTLTPYLQVAFWRNRLARMIGADRPGSSLEFIGAGNVVMTLTSDLMLAPIYVRRTHTVDIIILLAIYYGCDALVDETSDAARASYESTLLERWEHPSRRPVPDATTATRSP